MTEIEKLKFRYLRLTGKEYPERYNNPVEQIKKLYDEIADILGDEHWDKKKD